MELLTMVVTPYMELSSMVGVIFRDVMVWGVNSLLMLSEALILVCYLVCYLCDFFIGFNGWSHLQGCYGLGCKSSLMLSEALILLCYLCRFFIGFNGWSHLQGCTLIVLY
ncbi:hypothetical protein DsansV1_C08g0085421 [Dioscorea sansibarensis]